MSDLTTHPADNTDEAPFLAPEPSRNAAHDEQDRDGEPDVSDANDASTPNAGTLAGASATYSPDDNKLRLYAVSRLDAATFERVKGAGFRWAPRQELFVAPTWSPGREDLLIELCGEIGDEDTRLVDRAEVRAERFDGYGDSRAADANAARDAVARIADNIPLGQPILLGHHSERHARKDAERIENGMRRAVKMWDTAQYWQMRAEGARAHAEYKERTDVRHRRIKTIEADRRKVQKTTDETAVFLKMWREVLDDSASSVKRKDGEPTTAHERALFIANRDHVSKCFNLAEYPREAPASQYEGMMSLWSALDGGVCTAAQAQEIAIRVHERGQKHRARWLAHYDNRLTYERAMLDEQGGLAADKFDLQPGGVVEWRGRRAVIVRVNRKDGKTLSVTVAGQGWTVGIEEITAYEPPTEQTAAAVARAVKLAPICNYPSDGCATMTQAQWAEIYKDHKGTRTIKATETLAAHRRRFVSGFLGTKFGAPRGEAWGYTWVHISDAKETRPADPNAAPKSTAKAPRKSTARKIAEAAGIDISDVPDEASSEHTPAPTLRDLMREASEPTIADVHRATARIAAANQAREESKAESAPFDAMREQLRTGVQVVVAPQLFPTPPELAARMVELADLHRDHAILEPSGGTGRLLVAIRDQLGQPNDAPGAAAPGLVAVEIKPHLADVLRSGYRVPTHCADFLGCTSSRLGLFDRILMNPPFANGDDIKHIRHAFDLLKPGGMLVAICANGPRQNAALRPMVAEFEGEWEDLPEGTFKDEGTNVRTALITLRKP